MMAEVLGGIVSKVRGSITDSIDFLLMIIGAGASGAVVEVVRSWIPTETLGNITDETLAAIVGFLLFYFGDRIHRRLVPFGLGVFLAAAGAWAGDYVNQFIRMFAKK